MELKTIEQVRRELAERGQNIAEWARSRGFSPSVVRAVLYRKARGKWGEAHRVAVALGLKKGQIESALPSNDAGVGLQRDTASKAA